MRNYISRYIVPISAITTLLAGIALFNFGVYYGTKDELINRAINGDDITFKETVNPEYKSPVSKLIETMSPSLCVGDDIANKRFQGGRFNDIIESHRK